MHTPSTATAETPATGLPRSRHALRELKTVAGALVNSAGLVILLSHLAQWHAG